MVKRIFQNSLLLLDLASGDILSAGFIIMFLSMASGIFGLLRDRLLATQFTPDLVGIYFAAFVIPDNIFQILIVSSIGAAFIPVFTKYQKGGEQWQFTQSLFYVSLLLFSLCLVIAFIFIEPLSSFLAPGIQKESPTHIALLMNLTRIILVAQFFFVFSYICTGILQSYQRFIIPALAPAFYNIGIVIGILFFAPTFGMYGVAIGIVIGAFLHLSIQLPFVLRAGFSLRPVFIIHRGIKEIGILMTPRAISIAIERVKITIDTNLSSLISLSSITYLNYASHVAVFPVSLFAAAISQAALPFLAKAAANGDGEEFKKHVVLSLTHIAFFLAPTSVLLVILSTPIVRLIFGAERFTWEATNLTRLTLAWLSLGLFSQGASTLLARGFYALLDTKTPLVMTIISTAMTILLNLFFVLYFHFPVWSLALATSIGASINTIFLLILLDKKIGGFPRLDLIRSLAKIFLISIFLAIFARVLFKTLEGFFDTTYGFPLLLFTLLITLTSGIFYVLLSFIFNLEEYQAIFFFFKKAGKIREKLLKETTIDEPAVDS